jgi:hypothetical protein
MTVKNTPPKYLIFMIISYSVSSPLIRFTIFQRYTFMHIPHIRVIGVAYGIKLREYANHSIPNVKNILKIILIPRIPYLIAKVISPLLLSTSLWYTWEKGYILQNINDVLIAPSITCRVISPPQAARNPRRTTVKNVATHITIILMKGFHFNLKNGPLYAQKHKREVRYSQIYVLPIFQESIHHRIWKNHDA